MLTIAYLTSRKNPRIEWFFDSLHRQMNELRIGLDEIKVVVVDFYAKERFTTDIATEYHFPVSVWTVPKPNVWQGEHRLTKENWFDASNARNTALCYAPDGFIAFVDDLSVLMPGWLKIVHAASFDKKIIYGSYKKVKKLVVESGKVMSCIESPEGMDSRSQYAPTDPWPCAGSWMFGCSCAMPVEALLTINGFPEDLCAGLGSEDSCCGVVLQNAGFEFLYDRRMMTFESEEGHHEEPAFRRDDWHFENGVAVRGGNGKD